MARPKAKTRFTAPVWVFVSAAMVQACASDVDWPNLADPIVTEPDGPTMADTSSTDGAARPSLRLNPPAPYESGNGDTSADSDVAARLDTIESELDALKAMATKMAPKMSDGTRAWLTARISLTRLEQDLIALKRAEKAQPDLIDDAARALMEQAASALSAWQAKLGAAPVAPSK